jgi:hypothetical protein
VINFPDAIDTLGGFPFDNSERWYFGSKNDLMLNLLVKRFVAENSAIESMQTFYNTMGELEDPLITMHTFRDQQIPYLHEFLYALKTISKGTFISKHVNIPVNRYGHCKFTAGEALAGFALMLLYAGDLELLTGVGAILDEDNLETFESMASNSDIPYDVEGKQLEAVLRK